MKKTLVLAGLLLATAVAGAAGGLLTPAAPKREAASGPRREAAPDPTEKRGVPWRGNPGITQTVAQIMERQARMTLPSPGKEVSSESERRGERPLRQPN